MVDSKKHRKEWYQYNRERQIARMKVYWKKYYQQNKDKIRKQNKKWIQQNKDKHSKIIKEWTQNNKDRYSETLKRCYQRNKEKLQKRGRENFQRNKERIRLCNRTRLYSDPLYAFTNKIRGTVRSSFKRIGQDKPAKTEELLGCTWQEAREHFNHLFSPGMNWNNISKWHIDHKKPVKEFYKEAKAASTIEESKNILRKMNHISNLQPLWGSVNLSKGCKYGQGFL